MIAEHLPGDATLLAVALTQHQFKHVRFSRIAIPRLARRPPLSGTFGVILTDRVAFFSSSCLLARAITTDSSTQPPNQVQ